MFVTDQ